MSRSGYTDDIGGWALIRWRGAVVAAIRGKRGQELLREMAAALDSMPVKELVESRLEKNGQYCALGVVGLVRGIKLSDLDPDDYVGVASAFGISQALAREIVYVNDEGYADSPRDRWKVVREWVEEHLKTNRSESL